MKINVRTKINKGKLQQISTNAEKALIMTAEALKTDLYQSQTMPFDTGDMQNRHTFTDITKVKKGTVKIVSSTPYARKVYFHPEYNFKKDKNKNAQGRWFDTYISGSKKDLAKQYYIKIMKKMEG